MKRIFNSHLPEPLPSSPHNHQKAWLREDIRTLANCFYKGDGLFILCKKMGRTTNSILPKLITMKLIESTGRHYIVEGNTYYYTDVLQNGEYFCPVDCTPKYLIDSTSQSTTTESETIMTQTTTTTVELPAFEMKPLIYGVDATKLSDDQIFNKIGEMESQLATLNRIENKPNKLKEKIAKLEEAIKKVVTYVDGRDE